MIFGFTKRIYNVCPGIIKRSKNATNNRYKNEIRDGQNFVLGTKNSNEKKKRNRKLNINVKKIRLPV